MAKWNRDPQVRAVTDKASLNQVLADRILVHHMDLQRLGNNEAAKVLRLLEAAHDDLMGQFARRMEKIKARGVDWGPATTRRMAEMEYSFDQIIKGWGKDAYNLLRDDLVELARDETRFNRQILDDASPVKLETVLPARRMLRTIVTEQPFDGLPLRGWFTRQEAAVRSSLVRAVRIGMTQGQTIDQMARTIRGTRANGYRDGILEVNRRQAQTIARTATNHVSTQSRRAFFAENADLVKGEIWLATLDTRTCFRCADLDRAEWKFGLPHEYPPAHPGCRCTITPVLKSWKELGINLPESAKGARASMNGVVPEDTDYQTWLSRQSKAVQVRALGPGRAKLFREGKVQAGEFTSESGHPITIRRLQAMEGRAVTGKRVR